MMLKLSVGQLALAILACGVAFRALSSPSVLWARTLLGLAIATCILALIGAARTRGRARASCTSAAICGGAYLLAIHGPWTSEAVAPHLPTGALLDILHEPIKRANLAHEIARKEAERARLVAEREQAQEDALAGRPPSQATSMNEIHSEIEKIDMWIQDAGSIDGLDRGPTGSAIPEWVLPDRIPPSVRIAADGNFLSIGHSLFAIASALVGAAFGRFMADPARGGARPEGREAA